VLANCEQLRTGRYRGGKGTGKKAGTEMIDIVAGDDPEWAERSRHWGGRPERPKDKRVRRHPSRDPLILAGHGVSLQVEAGTLLIRNGFTHYPQKQETYRYFKGDAGLPQRIIVLDGSGSITFDVLTWLNEQKVPFVKIDWTGNAVTVVSGDGFAANRDRVARQAETRSNRRRRMEFCNALIAKKIEGCMLTMETSLRRSQASEAAMQRANSDLARLANDPPQTVDELRMLEAHSASAYFRAWRATSVVWRASSRHPIPDEWEHSVSARLGSNSAVALHAQRNNNPCCRGGPWARSSIIDERSPLHPLNLNPPRLQRRCGCIFLLL
jgi:hypothetical protein